VNILIRCDGSPEIGLGHVVRCLALTDELHEVHNCHITFAMVTGPLGIQTVKNKGYPVITYQNSSKIFDYEGWLNECVSKSEAEAIIFDVRDGLTRTVMDNLRKKGILTVTIDDPEDKRLSADLAFYPPIPQIKLIDWTGFTGELHIGWKWVIIRKEFSTTPCSTPNASCSKIPKILVTMGGSDPEGLTIKAVKALEMIQFEGSFEVIIVLGSGFQYKEELEKLISGCKQHFELRKNVHNMAELMAQSDLAVASFGMTAYELAAIGVPAIYLCLTEDHAESASAFVKEGMAISLGIFTQVSEEMIAKEINALLNNKSLLSKLTGNAKKHIDGKGTIRISRMVANSQNIFGEVTNEYFMGTH